MFIFTCSFCGNRTHKPHVVDCDFTYCTKQCEQAVHYEMVSEFGGSLRPGDVEAWQVASERKLKNSDKAKEQK